MSINYFFYFDRDVVTMEVLVTLPTRALIVCRFLAPVRCLVRLSLTTFAVENLPVSLVQWPVGPQFAVSAVTALPI